MLKLKWPRGKYNGRRITGFGVDARLDVALWLWKPRASWNWGQPYFRWLFFIIRLNPVYHYLDR